MAMQKSGVSDHMIDIVRPFHEGMEARVRIGEDLLEEIEWSKAGKYHGTHFFSISIYTCAVIERWQERVKDVEGVGTCILYYAS